ncbi:MAG: FAD-binding oxidoreductase [Candidatus Bathyarchaeia archaeon]
MIPKKALSALQSILGPDFVSDDPAICQAYSRGGYGKGVYDAGGRRPACVVLPGDTDEVRSVVRVCNRYRLPFIPIGTFYAGFCAPLRPRTVMVDLKRMDRLEIHPKDMFAVVEPYVTIAQLQTEAMKHGLYTLGPLCGSQVSVVANHLNQGFGQLGQRTGYANRRTLGVEWVLPDGELLRLGSLTNPEAGYFWGEGPGPDLRGILRGWFGHFGGLGIITRMAVKLFPLPFTGTPEPWGVTPSTGFTLPPERFRFYNIIYKSPEKMVEAMYEIGLAEIGAVCFTIPIMWRYMRKASSTEEFWQMWLKDRDRLAKDKPYVLRVALFGFASPKQLEYEERVLKDIVLETGGDMRPASRYACGETFKPGSSVEAYLPTGLFISQKFSCDSLDNALKVTKSGAEIKRRYTPPFIDDLECYYLNSYDFGHIAYGETVSFFDEEDLRVVPDFEVDSVEDDLERGSYPGAHWPHLHRIMGPKMENYHRLLKKIGRIFDPNNLSNRGLVGRPIVRRRK